MMRPVRPPNSVLSVVRYAFRLPPKALYAFAGGAARSDEGAVNQVKNRAVAAGANAIHFEDTHSEIWGSMVLAEALRCS